MTTVYDIANRALGLCRARTQQISSFFQPGPEVAAINLFFDTTRDNLLRQFPWSFAKSTVSLGSPLKTANPATNWSASQPAPPWTYEYAMPANCLNVRSVYGQPSSGDGTTIPPILVTPSRSTNPFYTWEVTYDGGAQVILTNAPSALASITLKLVDPDDWDVMFQQAMVAQLAANVSMPISGDFKMTQTLMEYSRNVTMEAMARSANEEVVSQDMVPDWLKARNV